MARLSPESGNIAGKGFDLQVDTSKAILFDPNSGLKNQIIIDTIPV